MRHFMMLTDDLLLLEDRMEFLQQRYHDRALELYKAAPPPTSMQRVIKHQEGKDEAEKLINFIVSLDPDVAKKNSQWLLNVLFRKNHPMPWEDLETATTVLSHYAQAKQARTIPREKHDINSFKSLSELAALLRGENQQIMTPDANEHAAMLKEAKVVYDGPDVLVLIPLTQKAACYFGRNTDWCTAWGNHKTLGLVHQGRHPTQTNRYKYYAANGPLFIIELKADGTLLQYHSESNQFMDMQDRALPDAKVRSLLQAHPVIMRAIGEDRFITTHLNALGIKAFSPQALLHARPDLLVKNIKTAADYHALPPETRAQPAITAAILLHKPEIKLPSEVFTPQVAATLRDESRQDAPYNAPKYVINAFQYFRMNEWPPHVTQAAIRTGELTREQLVAASQLAEPAFTAAGYHAFKIDAPDRGSLYLLLSGDSGSRSNSGWIEVKGDFVTGLALSDKKHLIKVLNALGRPPDISQEATLVSAGVYYNNRAYGLLADVGTPDVRVGDATLVRLGSRLVWIAQIGDQPTKLRLWLQGKILHASDRWPDDPIVPDSLSNDLMTAVRQLALKHRVRRVLPAEPFGMLNTKNGLVADFATFVACAKSMPTITYVVGPDDESMLGMATKAFSELSREEQQVLYAALQSDEPQHTKEDSERIYDLAVSHIKITFPIANSLMARSNIITDGPLRAKIMADSVHAMKTASALLASQPHAIVALAHSMPTFGKADAATYAKLKKQIDQINSATRAAIMQRHDDPEKYATDLSGRFGALNARYRY